MMRPTGSMTGVRAPLRAPLRRRFATPPPPATGEEMRGAACLDLFGAIPSYAQDPSAAGTDAPRLSSPAAGGGGARSATEGGLGPSRTSWGRP